MESPMISTSGLSTPGNAGRWYQSPMMRLVLLLLASIACLPMTTEAQTAGAATGARPGAADPITYTLRFPDAPRHYVDVEASFPAAGQKRIELMMAVWTPGSYLVREYARHVEGVEVVQPSGAAAPIKTRKNRWAIDTGGAARVVVRYRVYGREMTVRTNWIESRFALLQGAATYLTLVGGIAPPASRHAGPASRLDTRDVRTARDERTAAHVRGGRLRHAGGWSDRRRGSEGLRVHPQRQAALPGERQRGWQLGWRARDR